MLRLLGTCIGAAAILLVACGGGDEDATPTPSPTATPPSPTASLSLTSSPAVVSWTDVPELVAAVDECSERPDHVIEGYWGEDGTVDLSVFGLGDVPTSGEDEDIEEWLSSIEAMGDATEALMESLLVVAVTLDVNYPDTSEEIFGTFEDRSWTPLLYECVAECLTECVAAELRTDRPDPEAAARAEAEDLCPEEFMEPCVMSWVAYASSPFASALCVNEDAGTWFLETPGGVPGEPAEGVQVGDACGGEPSATVVALQSYP